MDLLRGLWRYKSTIIFLSTPLVFLPLPLMVPAKESLCAYTMILMGVYWMTEVLPVAVTSFLPLILFPTLGLMGAAEVSKAYMSDTVWLFIGGLVIAVGVEQTELHKRISLRILTLIGSNSKSLMFGFMATTFLLSMWISNTATTAMILPIVEAVSNELSREDLDEEKNNVVVEGEQECGSMESEGFLAESEKSEHRTNIVEDGEWLKLAEKRRTDLKKGLAICVPYAASIGGTATINGTGTNVVFVGQYAELFPNSNIKISFASWMMYALPSAVVFFLCAYCWLAFLYLDLSFKDFRKICCRKSASGLEQKAKKMLEEEYRKLGSISWSETTVLIVFVITALLWLFRDPGFIPGWGSLFADDFVDDGTVAVAMSSMLFFLPSKKPEFFRRSAEEGSPSPVPPVLTWESMLRFFPCSVVFLLGGGFALAQGATESGLSVWLGEQLGVLRGIEPWIICIIISILMCCLTEFTTNVATAALFIPILATLAQTIEVHPIYLLVPPVLATSMAFMLPVATPPNAIAFSYGHIKVVDMVKAGSLLNVMGVAIVTIFINTYGVSYFGLDEFPEWARSSNNSITA